MDDVATCPLCYVPAQVIGDAAACYSPTCPMHGLAVPLKAWNLLADRINDLEFQINELTESDRRRRGAD